MNMYCGRDTYCSTGATSLVDMLEPCGSHRIKLLSLCWLMLSCHILGLQLIWALLRDAYNEIIIPHA